MRRFFFFGSPAATRVVREMSNRSVIIRLVDIKRQMRERTVPVPAAQDCRDPEAVVRSGARRNQPIPSNSGGPCRSHPRPETVVWMNDALASRVMFHALCMMNLMHPTMPKMSCKWSSYLIITVRTTYNTRCLPLIEMIVEYWLLAPVAYLPFDPC